MSHHVPGLPWTDEQWAEANKVVQDAARKARVASSFLPLVGPLSPGQASVPELRMTQPGPPASMTAPAAGRLQIDDGDSLRLVTTQVRVHLTTQQAEDPDLGSAKQMLARGADVIGRLEDFVIFNQEPGPAPRPPWLTLPGIYSVDGGQQRPGLLGAAPFPQPVNRNGAGAVDSEDLVTSVAAAIQTLENNGHYAPFACVLGRDLYLAASTPTAAMVLPSDRIVPFLDGGPLRRSSVIPDELGLVVALAGSPIDLVVASDVHVKFLQISEQGRYILRVSERFVLRIKQPEAICRLEA